MKRLLPSLIWLCFFFLINLSNGFAQAPDSTGIYSFAPVMPTYKGGDAALYKFINDNIQFPQDALKELKTGRVQIRIIIDESGLVSGVRVLRGVYPSLDSEAVRVIKLTSGQWESGKVEDKTVKVYKTIPVSFKIDTTHLPVHQEITFIGGDTAYQAFLKKYMQIPGAVVNHNLWGTVSVAITLNSFNKITNTILVRGAEAEMNDEALRLASLTQGKWIRTPLMSDQGSMTIVIEIPFIKEMVHADGSNVQNEGLINTAMYTDSLFKVGYLKYRQNDVRAALSIFEDCMVKNRKNLAAAYMRMLCYLDLEQYERACSELDWLIQVPELKSNTAELHLHYCTLQFDEEKRKKRNIRTFLNPQD